jgi:hypothetical protein
VLGEPSAERTFQYSGLPAESIRWLRDDERLRQGLLTMPAIVWIELSGSLLKYYELGAEKDAQHLVFALNWLSDFADCLDAPVPLANTP